MVAADKISTTWKFSAHSQAISARSRSNEPLLFGFAEIQLSRIHLRSEGRIFAPWETASISHLKPEPYLTSEKWGQSCRVRFG